MTKLPHILVVDDDPRIRTLLRRYLEGEGFEIEEAADGEAMLRHMAKSSVDLVMLDLMIPGEDGLSLARKIRATSAVPIIIVTGKGELTDRVVGLELGADDYITKPFHLREVLARIRTVLRRSAAKAQVPESRGPEASTGDCVRFDGWRFDLARRELHAADGSLVPLTTAEYQLLAAFVRSANRVLDRDRLMDLTRGRDWSPLDRSIDTQIGRLRKKIEADPAHPQLVKTVRGAGYVFTPKVEAA